MAVTEIALLIVLVMNVVLALLVVSSNRHDPVNIYFSLFAGSLALWAGALILFRIVESSAVSAMALKVSYLAAVLIASTFYMFIHYFPDRAAFGKFQRWFLTSSTIFLTIFLLLPGILITEVRLIDSVRVGLQEPFGYVVFAFYFILYFFGSLGVLYRKWRREKGETRTKLSYILWSILTAGILGATFNLLMPSPFWGEWRFTWLGPIFTAIIVIAVSYAITKHHLLNVRVIAAEMLSAGMVFVLFVQLVLSRTIEEVLLRFVFFALFAFFGSFLVRSVRNEVKQREELSKLSKQLERANEELKRLDETKSEFVSIASHQLRTPLTVIKGYLSMIFEGSFGRVPKAQQAPMEKVFDSSERLIELVENLLSVSRIESGRMKYNFEATKIEEMATSVVDELSEPAKKKKLALKLELPKVALPELSIDREKLRQVMMNLTENAIKYTEKGSVVVTVKRMNPGDDDHVTKPSAVYAVTDTGAGVRPEDQPRLFQKFVRGQGQTVQIKGTGLGLYVGRMMVEAHGGKIWVTSPGEGQGSTFMFSVPLPQPKRDPAAEAFATMLDDE